MIQMEDISLDSLVFEDEAGKELKANEQKYHEVFQELSSTRTDLRKTKHDNHLLRTNVVGLQEEVDTLRDILAQKKQIIEEMRMEGENRTSQLDCFERENSELAREKEELKRRLSGKMEDGERVKEELQEKRQEVEDLKVQVRMSREENSQNKERLHMFQTKILELEDERKSVVRLLARVSSLDSISQNASSFEEMIQHLVSMSSQHHLDKQSSTKRITSLESHILQLQDTLNSQVTSLSHKEQELHLLRNQNLKDRSHIEHLTFHSSQQLLSKQAALQESEAKLHNLTLDLSKCNKRVVQLEQKQTKWASNSVENVMPLIRAVLGEELAELVGSYGGLGEEEALVIAGEIDRQCSLMLYNQNRQAQVDTTNQQLKNRLLESDEQNGILRIKLANLQKAYEHAIDDYRRSLRFKALCQPCKPLKENLSTNY